MGYGIWDMGYRGVSYMVYLISHILYPSLSIAGQSKFFYTSHCYDIYGPLAQLVARLHGMEEVTGSSPVGSILRSLEQSLIYR